MRVLQVIKGLDIGGANGGSEKFGLELSRRLRAVGASVSLCAFYRYGTVTETALENQLRGEGVDVLFGLERGQGNPWPGFRRLAQFCRSESVQIVHSHFQVGSLAAVSLKQSGVVDHIIRTAHISKEWGDGAIAWAARQIFTNGWFPVVFDAEVGVSKGIVDRLDRRAMARVLHKRATCIYNGLPDPLVDEALGRVQARWARAADESRFVIGSVGRLTPRKGYRYLIEAMGSIVDSIPNACLMLVGEGEERRELTELARRLHVERQVEFLGQSAGVMDLLGKMDLFVLPSLQEGLPTAIMESMACGTPVVASDIPGTRELVTREKNGWLVEPANPEALARAIISAYQRPDLRQKYSLQAAASLSQFKLKEIAASYLNLYSRGGF